MFRVLWWAFEFIFFSFRYWLWPDLGWENNIGANHRSALERKIRARDSSGFQKPLSPVWVKTRPKTFCYYLKNVLEYQNGSKFVKRANSTYSIISFKIKGSRAVGKSYFLILKMKQGSIRSFLVWKRSVKFHGYKIWGGFFVRP